MHESLHSIILGQIIGLYLVITSIIMIARAKYYRTLLTNLKVGSSTMVGMASFGLMLGLFLVVIHNVWVMKPELLVTIVAWIILIKSIFWLALPETMVKYSRNMYSGWGYYFGAIVAGLIGIILLAFGYYSYIFPTQIF